MQGLPWWLPLLARLLTVVGVAGPALEKVFDYPGQVAFFTRLGIPQPGVMVVVSAITELAAAGLIAVGVAGRLAALALLGNMLVAIVTAGLNPLSGLVFLSAAVVALLGTGRFSLWRIEDRWLLRLPPRR